MKHCRLLISRVCGLLIGLQSTANRTHIYYIAILMAQLSREEVL